MDRNQLQEITARVLDKDKRVICQWATGCGKTNIALKFLNKHPQTKCLIVVPETDNKKNWAYEFEKFHVSMENVEIICYASLHNYRDTEWGLIVYDEAPHVDTPLKKDICLTIKSERVLALGAFITEEQIQTLVDCYGRFRMSTISLDSAINMGILPQPIIVVMHLRLTKEQRKRYDLIEGRINKLKEQNDEHPSAFVEGRLRRLGLERKRYLGALKTEKIKWICDTLDKKGKRYLCFCSSVKQAKEIGGNRAYTAQSSKSDAHLHKFNTHQINALFVVGKLIEGQNLVDIEYGVIGQVGGKDRISIQAMGRIMRSLKPVIYVPIFDDTKDADFLYSITNNVSKEYIKHYNY